MPIVRPSRSTLLEDARAEIESRLPGADARLRRSLLDVFARVSSAQTHGLYGFAEFHTRQAFPQLAVAEYLRRHAEQYGVAELPPDYARGPVTLTGTAGQVVEQDTSLRRADGREYVTLAQATLGIGGTVNVDVIAVAAGEAGDAITGTALTFASPVPGVNASAVVAAPGLAGGADPESDENLRSRVLARIQEPPAGGTIYDYQARAKLYPGVTDVYVHSAQFGAGTVGVAPLFYDRVSPIPTGGDIAAIQALVTDPAFKPVCATITVYALVAEAQAFNLHVAPDTADVRSAIIAELQALFRREAKPGGLLLISHIREAISTAAGETDYTLATPAANVDLSGDLTKISTVGAFTWT